MFSGPPGMAVSTVLTRLPVPSVHPPAFELSNRSSLMSSTLRGKTRCEVGYWQSAHFETTNTTRSVGLPTTVERLQNGGIYHTPFT